MQKILCMCGLWKEVKKHLVWWYFSYQNNEKRRLSKKKWRLDISDSSSKIKIVQDKSSAYN